MLDLTIGSLARQSVPAGTFEVLLVDNGSDPAVRAEVLAPLSPLGIATRLVQEDRPGVARARLRAIRETQTRWILFVDDDNELSESFVDEGLRFIAHRPDVACFGGKLLLPPRLRPPRWVEPFLPYLAIRDAGDEVIAGIADHWGQWEPPTAGAFVRRDVADAYRERVETEPRILELGRRGPNSVASCEDSLMMRQALDLGVLNAYDPRLTLRHHIDGSRFRFRYLMRLMGGYGTSHVLLEKLERAHRGQKFEVPDNYRRLTRFLRLLFREIDSRTSRTSLPFALGLIMYHWRARQAYLREERDDR